MKPLNPWESGWTLRQEDAHRGVPLCAVLMLCGVGPPRDTENLEIQTHPSGAALLELLCCRTGRPAGRVMAWVLHWAVGLGSRV